MQKAGVLAGLIGCVGLAVYAFPTSDKRLGNLIEKPALAIDRDGPAPSALDKLKASTQVGQAAARPPAIVEPQLSLPAPRVMESVRQELTRPTTAASANAATTRTPDKSDGQAGAAGFDRLTARSPETGSPTQSAPITAAAPTAAAVIAVPLKPSTLVVPGQSVAVTPVASLASPAHERPAAGPAAAEPARRAKAEADPADRARPSARPEKPQTQQRTASSTSMARPAAPAPAPHRPSAFGRNDGL